MWNERELKMTDILVDIGIGVKERLHSEFMIKNWVEFDGDVMKWKCV